ncbi:MAG TPA: hypothetical protein VEY07_07930 [Thermoplasmata archaeon]|nr:hypothetical protein [Thermoplasmata archaeon]
MRPPLRRHGRGLSEIVGALMLVLIVVGAATALSLFVASYQKQLQAEQAINQARSLESIKILRATTILNASASGSTTLLDVNFTVASLNVNPAVVTGISVNNHPVRNYTVWQLNLTTGRFESDTVAAGGELQLSPREQFNVLVDGSGGVSGSFYDPTFLLHTSDYLQVDVLTAYENDFRTVFLPPTAIALVSLLQTWNGTAFVPVPLLDGSQSFQPGNATLVGWSWSISPDNTTAQGEKVAPRFAATGLHTILLTVTNSLGLIGTAQVQYST